MTTDPSTPIVPTPEWREALLARFWHDCRDERIQQAIALRQRGWTYQEIADRLGYADRCGAYYAVNGTVIAQEAA